MNWDTTHLFAPRNTPFFLLVVLVVLLAYAAVRTFGRPERRPADRRGRIVTALLVFLVGLDGQALANYIPNMGGLSVAFALTMAGSGLICMLTGLALVVRAVVARPKA